MPLSLDRLELLLRVAEQGEDDARRQFAVARQKVEDQSRMRTDLLGYLDDYQRPSTSPPTAVLLENRRLFVLRLQAAVETQTRQVEMAAALAQQAEARWLETRRALRIAEQMHDVGRRTSLQVEERRAQRQQDDDTLQRRAAAERAW